MIGPVSIYMVEARKGGYLPRTQPQFLALKADLIFEGVDGDEEANTVTYWYRRATDEDPA